MGNLIEDKSFAFAVRIVKLSRYLQNEKSEGVLSKQLLRSGTSIGANVSEAVQGQSKADFVAKMNIALKETAETKYWIRLLRETEYLPKDKSKEILDDCIELEKLLYSIVRTTKMNMERGKEGNK